MYTSDQKDWTKVTNTAKAVAAANAKAKKEAKKAAAQNADKKVNAFGSTDNGAESMDHGFQDAAKVVGDYLYTDPHVKALVDPIKDAIGLDDESSPSPSTDPANPSNKNPKKRGGGSGSGGGAVVAASSVNDDPYSQVYKLIDQYTQKNNAWSAKQAQIDREWQERMSSSAHQREVRDLQAAGLNPVLSAGGSGASTPSGAMGQTDTSNTRAVADVAMYALEAMANTAVGVARAGGRSKKNSSSPAQEKNNNSILSRLMNGYKSNNLVKKVVDTGLNVVSGVVQKGLWKAFFA